MSKTKQQIVTEVLDAVDCARRGEPHPRLFNHVERSIEVRLARVEARKMQVVKGGLMPPKIVSSEPVSYDPYSHQPLSTGPGNSSRND
ncbi:hypothetical protein fHeYen801_054c [Yersinia phage fHe-Yen8-01]|nr:hypothetical protein fHeYen801_054c [Yersinia phage fHe-Yen8-01]